MVLLAFKLRPDTIGDQLIARQYFDDFLDRCSAPWNIVSKPFKAYLKRQGNLYAFEIEHSWPALWLYAWVAIALVIITGLPGWLFIPLGFMSLLVVFWMPGFYLFMFRLGLRKAGFKGRVKGLSFEAAFREVFGWGR